MTKKKAIKRVATLAKSRENKAAKNLADSLGRHKKEADKCAQITGYRAEYEAHFENLTRTGVDARTLSEYRQFLGNLDDAIDQQLEVVKTSEESVGASRSEWLSRYHRTSALEQLIEMQKKEDDAKADKRQQKEQDEINSTRSRRDS